MSTHTTDNSMFRPIANLLGENFSIQSDSNTNNLIKTELLNNAFDCYNHNQKPLKFIQQDEHLPYAELGYEERIYLHGMIATRSLNWHDFFNALVWKTFPQSKCAINAIHYKELKQQKSTLRSQRRDLLTLFDECGVVIIADNDVVDMIRKHKWHELFIDNKHRWLSGEIKIITFGHAMYEKYLSPYIGMTAKALLLTKEIENLDEYLAKKLIADEILINKAELSPLPVLGIPNWHKGQNKSFYSDKNYFR